MSNSVQEIWFCMFSSYDSQWTILLSQTNFPKKLFNHWFEIVHSFNLSFTFWTYFSNNFSYLFGVNNLFCFRRNLKRFKTIELTCHKLYLIIHLDKLPKISEIGKKKFGNTHYCIESSKFRTFTWTFPPQKVNWTLHHKLSL